MSSIFGSSNSAPATANAVPAASMRIQTSLEGVVRPIIYGTVRMAGNLIWYGGFEAIPVSTNSGNQGGKGGLFGSGNQPSSQVSSYDYYASVEIALGEGPIRGVGNMWADKSITTLTDTNLAVFLGTNTQTPWSFLVGLTNPLAALISSLTGIFGLLSASSTLDYAYRNTAYVAGSVHLGSSPELPNWTFEVAGAISQSVPGSSDADFTLVLSDFLTNANYGVPGWLSSYNGDWSNAQNYLLASNLLVSLALTSSTTASSLLQDLLTSLNVMSVWSDGVLKLVPRGDAAVSGNGKSYFPPTAPEYDLDDSDFLTNQAGFGNTNADPVSGMRKPARQQNNVVKVEYLDRTNAYNPGIARSADDGAILRFGERGSDGTLGWHWFTLSDVAGHAADLALGREKIANQYNFTLRPRYILLDPGDLVTITDPGIGLFRKWVRVLDVQENSDRTLNFLAEEYLQGTAAAPAYGREVALGNVPNYAADPGKVNAPLFFEPTDELAGGLQLWIATSGQNPSLYGGCDVFASYDNATFSRVPGGRQFGSARMGTLTVALPPVVPSLTAQTIDQLNQLQVDLTASNGELLSGSQTDALNLNTACWVDGEVIAYQTATLTASNKYTLEYLVRGVYGTEAEITTHAIGAPFVRIDNGILRIPFDKTRIGATIYLKFIPFNVWGVSVASLADVQAYTYTLQGTALASPLPNVTDPHTAFEAGFTKIYWQEVDDFRQGVRYLIKKGPSFAAAQNVGDVAHPPLIAFGDGVYWITAYCQPVAGLTVYSETPVSMTIAGSMLTQNVLATIDFQAETWTGTFANTGKEGTDPLALLRIDSAPDLLTTANVLTATDILHGSGSSFQSTGSWTSDVIFDAGYVADCSVNVAWQSAGQPVGQNVLSMAGILDEPDILAGASAAFVDVWVEIRIATTATLGVPNWGAFQRYVPGVYRAEYLNFRVQFVSDSPLVIAYLQSMTAQISIPARIDNYLANNVTTAGLTVTFEPDDASVAKPFNGGPLVGGTGNHPLPDVSMDWQGSPTANYIITALSLSAMTFHFIDNTGATVAVNGVNVHVEGY